MTNMKTQAGVPCQNSSEEKKCQLQSINGREWPPSAASPFPHRPNSLFSSPDFIA